MPHALELKAAVRPGACLAALLSRLGAAGPEILVQEDVHLRCLRGQIALRRTAGAAAELLAWRRDDRRGLTVCEWDSEPVDDPEAFARHVLPRGARGVVRRRRELWFLDNVRVHLDASEDGGERIEFVAPFTDEVSRRAAERDILALAARLGVRDDDRLVGSVADELRGTPVR